MAILTLKSGPEPGRVIELKPGVNRIGRAPENDFQVNDPSISTAHCEIQVADIAVSVKDLGSTNGTFINQRRIAKGILHNGDMLTLGGVEFETRLPEVNIAIPDIPKTEEVFAAFLEDGTPACYYHRDFPATLRCLKCEHWFCPECVRVLKRPSGGCLHFCLECSGPCEPISTGAAQRKKSLFTRLGETLRLTRKK